MVKRRSDLKIPGDLKRKSTAFSLTSSLLAVQAELSAPQLSSVLLVVSGEPQPQAKVLADARRKLASLSVRPDVVVYPIYLCKEQPKWLYQLADQACGAAFQLDEWREKLLPSLVRAPRAAAEPPVRIAVRCESDIEPVSELDKLDLQLVLHNKGEEPLSGIQVTFLGNDFFEERVCNVKSVVEGSVTWKFFLLAKPTSESTMFPEGLEYVVRVGPDQWRGEVSFSSGFVRGDFFQPEDRYNVLVLGAKGAGKSATLNSLITCVSKREQKTAFGVADVSDHVTDTFSSVEMRDMIKEDRCEALPFRFYDLWGVDVSTLVGLRDLFPDLVCGNVPEGTHRNDLYVKQKFHEQVTVARHMHCLVLVVRLGAYHQPEVMKDLNDMCSWWLKLNLIGPVIVVTAIDLVKDLTTRARHIEEMRAQLPVAQDVFFVENYVEEEQRVPRIDLQSRRVLLAIRDVSRRNTELLADAGYLLDDASDQDHLSWRDTEVPESVYLVLEERGVGTEQVLPLDDKNAVLMLQGHLNSPAKAKLAVRQLRSTVERRRSTVNQAHTPEMRRYRSMKMSQERQVAEAALHQKARY